MIFLQKGFGSLAISQTCSSFADHALYIIAIAFINELGGPFWLSPFMRWSFSLSYVLLSVFVGVLADSFPKEKLMFFTNILKILSCLAILLYPKIQISSEHQAYMICISYIFVGIAAAMYSPAKYGIVTEMLPSKMLVLGNSWIEGLTLIAIISGSLFGVLISNEENPILLYLQPFTSEYTSLSLAIVTVIFMYIIALIFNSYIPSTNVKYPKQRISLNIMIRIFYNHVKILWKDDLGRISLLVTTLIWGAGITLQVAMIEWGKTRLGYSIDQASCLVALFTLGTISGSLLASKIPISRIMTVMPASIIIGIPIMIMSYSYNLTLICILLFITGFAAGLTIVPMNALLQHRGQKLLSAGQSIAVQNFSEQLGIMIMISIYGLLLLKINLENIVFIFGAIVSLSMIIIFINNRRLICEQIIKHFIDHH